MFFPGIILLLLVAFFEGTSCISIGCGVTAEKLLSNGTCEYEKTCSVHCQSACLNEENAQVVGTVHYAVQSSICKSALHDLRISAGNDSARHVSFISLKATRNDYTGSLRYGVTSESSFVPSDSFGFQSPRIKEDVLDITALHRDYIYKGFTTSTLECHGPEDHPIYFDYSIKEVVAGPRVNFHPKPVEGAYIFTWPKGVYTWPTTRTNMLWCHVNSSTLSSIGSPAMYYNPPADLSFLPVSYTVTASIVEPAALQVRAGPGVTAEPHVDLWAKVNSAGKADKLSGSGSSTTWSISSAHIHHSGVYVAMDRWTISQGKHRALFRLIVRTCQNGRFGPLCNSPCPFCENGGICHDITGQCICPPGFKGNHCQEPCGDDTFGRECQHSCSGTNPDKNKSCRGILMCLPDPYGCSCGTGFHGPFCNETCPPHGYGADCKQSRVCFCKTAQFCDIHTGTCVQDKGACRQGWKNGPRCDKSYPLLRDGPLVSSITDRQATINFNSWNSSIDIGEGKPLGYRVDYKVGNETWISKTFYNRPFYGLQSVLLDQLRSGTIYKVRVLVIDEDKNYREYGASVSEFQTTCGAPALPPQNVVINSSITTKIVVKWTNPDRRLWNCWSVNVVLEVNSVLQEFNLTASGTSPTDMYTIPVSPYPPASIRLRLRTPDNRYSVWTKRMSVVSAEDAPSEPAFIRLNRAESRSLEMDWGRPVQENGVLRHYSVVYTPLKFLAASCGFLEQRTTEVTVPPSLLSANLTDLRPYTMYHVSVAAVTVRAGNAKNVTVSTLQAVPDGEPTHLSVNAKTNASVTLTWSEVPCEVVNGEVRGYYVELESRDAWETKLRNLTVRGQVVQYPDLVPYTGYQAKVFAVNDAGRSLKFATLNFTTDPAAPPPPSDLAYDQLSQVSVSLSWDAPYPPYGILVLYELTYCNGENAVTYQNVTDITQLKCTRRNPITPRHCYTVQNLDPNKVYHFKVRAKNEGSGYSAYSSVREVETKEMPPEAPTRLQSLEETEDSLRIQWEPPSPKNGVLTSYQVTASLSHSHEKMAENPSQPQSMNLSSSEKTEVSLRDLLPRSMYLVCVKASTSAGFGDAICENFSTKGTSDADVSLHHITGSLLGLVALVALGSGVTCYCKRKKEKIPHSSHMDMDASLEDRLAENLRSSLQASNEEVIRYSQTTDYIPMVSYRAVTNTATAVCKSSNTVAIKRLHDYVTESLADGSLLQEYTSIRNRPLRPSSIEESKEHKWKNEHTRVVLKDSYGNGAEEINAIYIPDFKNPRQYIAAQGPTPSTTVGFWKLVWQEHALKIVIISGPSDQDKVAYRSESKQNYGAFTVIVKNTTLRTDFVVRELEVLKEDATRSVTQFHYTAWPHGCVPPFYESLHSFIAAVRSFHCGDAHPIIVLDRESTGRTGTFILIDSMITQAEAEGKVDVVKQVIAMQNSGMNTMETAELYIFVHKMLVEALCSNNQKLTIHEFLNLYQHLKAKHPLSGRTPISKEYERLCMARPHPGASAYKAARDERNASKNRTMKILAADDSRFRLSAREDSKKTDYINAVYVDGFKNFRAYLVTQIPLPHTVDDFWELVALSGSMAVVTLGPISHEEAPKFWPELSCSAERGAIAVEHIDCLELPFVKVRTFRVSQSMSQRIVKQFHCAAWNHIGKATDCCKIALDTINRVEHWQIQAGDAPVIVQCIDGCAKSGLFCVLASICNQLKNDHELDVFQCVQRVRRSRPEFIIDAEQYAFCYEVANAFLESFNGYANFA